MCRRTYPLQLLRLPAPTRSELHWLRRGAASAGQLRRAGIRRRVRLARKVLGTTADYVRTVFVGGGTPALLAAAWTSSGGGCWGDQDDSGWPRGPRSHDRGQSGISRSAVSGGRLQGGGLEADLRFSRRGPGSAS